MRQSQIVKWIEVVKIYVEASIYESASTPEAVSICDSVLIPEEPPFRETALISLMYRFLRQPQPMIQLHSVRQAQSF